MEVKAQETLPKAKPEVEPRLQEYPRPPQPTFVDRVKSILHSFSRDADKRALSDLEAETLKREIKETEHLSTKNGVDFSRIQIDKVIADRQAHKRIECETFSPYLSDYNLKTGEIWRDKLIPADVIGLELAKTFRELFPQARLVSLYDEYNTILPYSTSPRGTPTADGPQIVVPDEVKENFKENIVNLLKEKGAIPENAVEGDDYLMASESAKQDDAVELVRRLQEAGHIEKKGEEITFVNNEATNPLFKRVKLRMKNGKWLCEALDASAFLNPENLEITHIVVLPDYFRDQQDKVWEILQVLGIKPENYHNIFYDESIDPKTASETIKGEFAKTKVTG